MNDVLEESWHAGLVVEVTIGEDDSTVKYIPTQTVNHKVIIHPDSEMVRRSFFERSVEITKAGEVDRLFSMFCDDRISDYLVKLSGKRRLIQRVMRRLGITKHYKKLYSNDVLYMMLDYFYCDSHREAIEYGIGYFIQEKRNRGKKNI